jgi:hypothetical protein
MRSRISWFVETLTVVHSVRQSVERFVSDEKAITDQERHGALNAAIWLLKLFRRFSQFALSLDDIHWRAMRQTNGQFDSENIDKALSRLIKAGFLQCDHVTSRYFRDDAACGGKDA